MRERGVTAVAMEVSSHALAMGRVDGCRFDVTGFTQLAVDHLDFHGTEAAYFAAKQMLFERERTRAAVITVDDDGGRRMVAAAEAPTVTVGRSDEADWQVSEVHPRAGGGYDYTLTAPDGTQQSGEVRLMGRFNVQNAALAQVMLLTAGLDAAAVARGVAACTGVPGRMERVGPEEVALVVDYAHTSDALGRAIEAVTPDSGGHVIVVFGCGGDRDPGKRRPMGAVAAARASVVVVTDDNPRSERPDRVRQAVLAGAAEVPASSRAEVVEIGDRREAMEWAVRRARPGDVVLVAGKGHEGGQEVDGVMTPFDDRVELLAAWNRVSAESGGDR
jgi:UDP-N-acetylmuramoyl-L-alanyl-D-glutamate--2,6-diaminopimelate ligase